MKPLALLFLLLALFLGLASTLSYSVMWVGIAARGGLAFCGKFYPTGWMSWIEWNIEPVVLGGMVLIQAGAIIAVVDSFRVHVQRDK